MKIGNPADKPAPVGPAPSQSAPAADAARGAGAVAHPATPAALDASAKVELSSTASTLLLAGGASAEFDGEKVARISQAIADGTFKINPEAIADKLIANAQELLVKVQR